MKTAEEWSEHTDIDGISVCTKFIQQIQLDAMKEGMRRAKELVQKEIETCPQDIALKVTAIESIIHASEQLTIKDL